MNTSTIKNIFVGVIAVILAYYGIKLAFWILGTILNITFGLIAFLFVAIPVAIVAIPLFFILRKKLLGSGREDY